MTHIYTLLCLCLAVTVCNMWEPCPANVCVKVKTLQGSSEVGQAFRYCAEWIASWTNLGQALGQMKWISIRLNHIKKHQAGTSFCFILFCYHPNNMVGCKKFIILWHHFYEREVRSLFLIQKNEGKELFLFFRGGPTF